jgi:hypothetical protein
MNDDRFGGWDRPDDEPPLAPREVLERWVVPDPSGDLADRVVARLKAQTRAEMLPPPRRRRFPPWLAGAVAGALAAGLVLIVTQPANDVPASAAESEARVGESIHVRPMVSVAEPASVVEEPASSTKPAKPDFDALLPPVTAPEPVRKNEAKRPKSPPEPPEVAKTAVLRIGTSPGVPPAEVTVDGEPVGRTPVMSVEVTPGKHTVVFRFADRPSVTIEVVVADGETKVLKGG